MKLEPSFARVLAAMFYDALAVFAVLFMAATPWVLAASGEQVPAGSSGFQVYLLLVVNGYFALCWMRGGQTLGMRAWSLYVEAERDPPLTWPRAIARFWMALLSWLPAGMGIAWFAVNGRFWHDLATGTRVVYRPRQPA